MNKYAHLAPAKRRQPTLARMHEGKRRWETLAEALKARDSSASYYGAEFNAYYCPICSGYHVGHRPAQ